jgi:4-aminobutyrate aminotransferase-like enzyme
MINEINEKIIGIKDRAKLRSKEEYLNIIEKEAMGPKSKEVLKKIIEYEGWTSCGWTLFDVPPVIDRGEGAIIWDIDGNKYIDLMAGFGVESVGHANQIILDTIIEQFKRISHFAELPNELRAKLAEEVSKLAPGKKKVHFTITGSDAVENALKVARYYTSRPDILTFFGTYHGRSFGVASATSLANIKYQFWPLTARLGVIHVPYAYCYRCMFGKEYPDCNLFCAKFIEELFTSPAYTLRWSEKEINNIAAILTEPTQGAMGCVIPPKEWLSEIKKIAEEYDVLLIDDEVYGGWGRTGKWWACQHSNVNPDIMVTSKTIGSGIPFSLILTEEKIADDLPVNMIHSTMSGYHLGCAVALATIKIIRDNNLVERSAKLGEYFLKGLKDLQESHKLIGHVDGLGLWLRIELVKDRKTKEPAKEEAKNVQKRCMKSGVLFMVEGYYSNVIKIHPPLVIEKEQIDESLQTIDKELRYVEKNL